MVEDNPQPRLVFQGLAIVVSTPLMDTVNEGVLI